MIYKNDKNKFKRACLFVLIILLHVGCGKKIEPSKPLIKPISEEIHTTSPEYLEKLRQEYKELVGLIDEKIRPFGLKSLRKAELGDDDLEVRVWKGHGYPTLSGVILERKKNKWKAVYFPTSYFPDSQISEKPLKSLINLDSPVMGWDKLWSSLKEQDILTNKDDIDTEVGVVEPFNDSIMITVEVLIRKRYRHYRYHAPCYSKAEEAKKLLKAVKILEENFKIKLHDCSKS